jgi:hypothetical protein
VTHPKAHTFIPYAQLPAPIRHEIAFASRVYEAADILAQYRPAAQARGADWAIGWMTESIRAADEHAAREFGTIYRQRYGRPLPHVAADATILRFMPARGVVRQAVPRFSSAAVRAAFRASERLMPA